MRGSAIVPRMCPCGSGIEYDACCARFHRGATPATAVELMRARYSAFVRGEHAFLWSTLHRDHPDRASSTEKDFADGVARNARRVRYRALRVIDSDGPDADGIWRVLFHAQVSVAGKDASFVELSSFAADERAAILYVGGVTRPARAGIPGSIAAFES